MAPTPRKLISPEDWASEFGVKLATGCMDALLREKKKVGEDNYRFMVMVFLSGLISAFMNLSLRLSPQDSDLYSDEELMKFAENNFITLKQALSNAVAAGVQGGVQSWSGQEIEYFCQIKPVPDAINKKPC